MKGLLRKDWYMLWTNLKAMLLVIVCFTLAGGLRGTGQIDFLLLYPSVMVVLTAVSLLAYDEREKWNEYLECLPVSREDYVTEKYLVGLCCTVAVFALYALGALLRGAEAMRMLNVSSFLLSASLAGVALAFPFLLRFGVEKGRLAYALTVGLLIGGMTAVVRLQRSDALPSAVSGRMGLGSFAGFAALALYALSWRLSVALYQKREL